MRTLDILIEGKSNKRLCESELYANRKLGAKCAKALRTRLAELEAAAHVFELVTGRPHPLRGDRAGQFAVSLEGGKRLVFRPSVVPPPIKADGSIDWGRVDRVTIVFIGDYHD